MTQTSDLSGGLRFAAAPDAPTHVNAIIYGASGAGKSTCAATAPGPLLWVNAEGPNALAYARKTATARGTQIHEVRVGHREDPRPALRAVMDHIRSGAEPVCETVVIDTIGKIRDGLAYAIGGGKPSLPQWGEVGQTLEQLVRWLRDADVNVVLVAHESIEDDDGQKIVRPLIGGAATEKTVADMDIVAYLGVTIGEDGQARYMGQFVQARGRRAKDRSGALGASLPSDFAVWLPAFVGAFAGDDVPWDDPSDADALVAEAVETLDATEVTA